MSALFDDGNNWRDNGDDGDNYNNDEDGDDEDNDNDDDDKNCAGCGDILRAA